MRKEVRLSPPSENPVSPGEHFMVVAMPTRDHLDAYQTALAQYDRASRYTKVSEDILEYMRYPRRELTVNFPVRRDDGHIEMFTGYRVHHTTEMAIAVV